MHGEGPHAGQAADTSIGGNGGKVKQQSVTAAMSVPGPCPARARFVSGPCPFRVHPEGRRSAGPPPGSAGPPALFAGRCPDSGPAGQGRPFPGPGGRAGCSGQCRRRMLRGRDRVGTPRARRTGGKAVAAAGENGRHRAPRRATKKAPCGHGALMVWGRGTSRRSDRSRASRPGRSSRAGRAPGRPRRTRPGPR